jgi:hypothetical protein
MMYRYRYVVHGCVSWVFEGNMNGMTCDDDVIVSRLVNAFDATQACHAILANFVVDPHE